MELTRKNWIQLVAMTVVFIIAAFLVYNTTITVRMLMPRMVTQIKGQENCYYELKSGDHLEQVFFYEPDALVCVGTQISVNDDVRKDLVVNQKIEDLGIIRVQVLDEAGNTAMQADYDVSLMEDGQNLLASLPGQQTGWGGKTLTFVLEAEGIRDDVELKIGYTKKAVEGAGLSVNGEAFQGNLNVQTAEYQMMYWRRWFFIGCILMYLLLAGTYFLLFIFSIKPEQVFLFTGAVLAVFYLFLIPPLTVPDEEMHYKEAYYHLNRIMGKDQPENIAVMDKEDLDGMNQFETTPSLSAYDRVKEALKKKGRKEGVEEAELFYNYAPMITYLPGMTGIFLGKLLGLNGVLVIYLGRVCSILCYLFTMYWFIRLIPFGKGAAFIAAILPMTIQQCCSYSYDSIVIEIAFLYLAVLLGLLYEETPIQKWQIVLYVLFMVILSISKGGTYLPMCLLTMLIPASRFSDKKRKWIFVGIMAAIAIIAFFSSTLSYVLFVAAPTAEQAAGTYLEGENYGVAGLLREPFTFIFLVVRTLFLSGDGFLETMLGMQLGWLNIFVSRIVIYGLLLLMGLSVLEVEGEHHMEVPSCHKIFYGAVAVMSTFMVFVSMFMSWTSENSTEITGIQGRYFLPLLPMLLLLFRGKNILAKIDRSRAYMFCAVCLQCGAIYGILLSLERVL